MSAPQRPAFPASERQLSLGWIVASAFLLTLMLGCYSVVSFFQLGSETAALRNSCFRATGGEWHKRIALNAGWLSTGLARVLAGIVNLPPEARTALAAVHGAEVGVYRQQGAHPASCWPTLLDSADRAMGPRGWERVVGVVNEHELVVVYMPCKRLSPERVGCCVMVAQGEDLVVVGARGNLKPLLSLARDRVHFREMHFALR